MTRSLQRTRPCVTQAILQTNGLQGRETETLTYSKRTLSACIGMQQRGGSAAFHPAEFTKSYR